MTPVIEASALSKFYGGHAAIENVSFRIQEGEIVGLLGLNGAGKSTILKILGTFLLPSVGSARIGGLCVEKDADAVRRLIGYLPDTPPLYDEMTVADYLRFVARIKNVSAHEVEQKAAAAIAKTNLQEVADVALGELSHGFRQRAGIAQALVHDPKVLILDEPINGLDPVQIVEMRDLILSLRGRHTVILSSHILSEITKTCDRILIIDEGRLVAEGVESDLERRMASQFVVTVEVDAARPELAASLSQVNGVTKVETLDKGKGFAVHLSSDVRSAVANHIVKSGAGLVELAKRDAGLEGLFMKLVRSSHHKEARHG